MGQLEGLTTLITGASAGIGRTTRPGETGGWILGVRNRLPCGRLRRVIPLSDVVNELCWTESAHHAC